MMLFDDAIFDYILFDTGTFPVGDPSYNPQLPARNPATTNLTFAPPLAVAIRGNNSFLKALEHIPVQSGIVELPGGR